MAKGYDIIGDIHGHADTLVALLKKMGYSPRDGAWTHAERQAIFVGDLIDLGPKQVETVMLVKRMVESGSALAVLGNHDLNAIAWYSPDPASPGEYLRPRFSEKWGAKHRHQHSAFLAEVENKPELHKEIIRWFSTLPLWLDLPGIRVVHACWHSQFVEYLRPILLPGARLSEDLMPAATREPGADGDSGENDTSIPSLFNAVEALTKGVEVALPAGISFRDKYGIARTRVRIRWWNEQATTYRTAALLDDSLCETLSDNPIPENSRVFHATDQPVFVGHYWMTGTPAPLTDKVACVDYSIGNGGPLCAYRWHGESILKAEKFCCVHPA
jgi:Calcineurin-like phosphoesterase